MFLQVPGNLHQGSLQVTQTPWAAKSTDLATIATSQISPKAGLAPLQPQLLPLPGSHSSLSSPQHTCRVESLTRDPVENFLLRHDHTSNTHAPFFTSELTQAKDGLVSHPCPANSQQGYWTECFRGWRKGRFSSFLFLHLGPLQTQASPALFRPSGQWALLLIKSL